MRRTVRTLISAVSALLVVFVLAGCLPSARQSVVVYVSVDQNFAEPILERFEETSGIDVKPVFDVEAAKTTGLVNRIIAEKDRPQADVFWNGEFAQTLLLKQRGVLAPYQSPVRADIPPQFQDPEGYWTGSAGRARVLLVNTERVSAGQYPNSIYSLLDDRWPADRVAIAYPLFGTTLTHAAALYATLGDQKAEEFFNALRDRGVRLVDGNAVVRDLVVSGQLDFGLTDTDDACGAVRSGAPVALVYPDQDSLGTLVVVSTAALVAGGPNPEPGKKLIDYLTSREVEAALIDSGFCQVPTWPIASNDTCLPPSQIKPMAIDYGTLVERVEPTSRRLSEIFVR